MVLGGVIDGDRLRAAFWMMAFAFSPALAKTKETSQCRPMS
jgi:hypothetical protein